MSMLINILFPSVRCFASATESGFDVDAKSALLMEYSSGKIIYEKDSHQKLPPASVTKVMTMLLVMEAVDAGKITLNDKVTASEFACSMGGTQIFLSPGEVRTVEELLKGVAIESANDAAVALAEFLGGTEEQFVHSMNERAKELGMKDTVFSNCNGLPIENHYTSAYDIALMSRELLKHRRIFDYTRIWSETITEGRAEPFTMYNKNKLVRFYRGCDGLKTGSTSEAKFCISATALRDGMRLIAVIMGSPTSKIRNREASKMLDLGFAKYGVIKLAGAGEAIADVKTVKGRSSSVKAAPKEDLAVLVEKGSKDEVSKEIRICKEVGAPVKKGDKLGEMIASVNGAEAGRVDIVSLDSVDRAGASDLIGRAFHRWLLSE